MMQATSWQELFNHLQAYFQEIATEVCVRVCVKEVNWRNIMGQIAFPAGD